MLRLVIKDILIQKKTFIGALIYLIFVIFAFQGLEGNAYTAAIVAFSYLMVMEHLAMMIKINRILC